MPSYGRTPNTKTFDKKKEQLVKTLKRAKELCDQLADRQTKRGATYFNSTANRWVGFELDTLIERAGALNE